MKRIAHYAGDSKAFHRRVMDSKRRREVLQAELRNHTSIELAYEEYDIHFAADTLESLNPIALVGPTPHLDKDELLKIYSFKGKVFQELLKSLTIDAHGRKFMNHCPLCSLDLIGSFDHIVPKEEFVEFIDHPKNLIPCCTHCNSKKNKNWCENGQRIYLNHYIDDIQHFNFLGISDKWNAFNIPSLEFSVIRPAGIANKLYEKVKRHYKDLDLCNRYTEESGIILEEISSDFRSLPGPLSDDLKKQFLKNKAEELHRIEGESYWKGHIYELCAISPRLFNYVNS